MIGEKIRAVGADYGDVVAFEDGRQRGDRVFDPLNRNRVGARAQAAQCGRRERRTGVLVVVVVRIPDRLAVRVDYGLPVWLPRNQAVFGGARQARLPVRRARRDLGRRRSRSEVILA
jgi:hypothetical protein